MNRENGKTAERRPPRRKGPAAPQSGQRESRRAPIGLLGLIAALPCLLPAAPVRVETPAPVLDVCVGRGIVVAGMGLEGVAWFPVDDPARLRVRAEWPSLSALSLGDDGFLLCGRDGVVRVVEPDPATGDMALRQSWPVEGIPNEAVAFGESGELLALACGGGGLSVWDWTDRTAPARLVGRYPFVGFARSASLVRDGILAVADSHEFGAMAVDATDPLRPRKLGALAVRGYCDDVAWDGSALFSVNRYYGTSRLEADEAFSRFEVAQHFAPLVPDDPDYRAVSVLVDGERLFVCELKSGVRVFRRNTDGYEHRTTIRDALVANDVAVVDAARIAVADFAGAVAIVPLPPEKPTSAP